MGAQDIQGRRCDPLKVYAEDEPQLGPALLWVALIHCYCVVVFGTLGNALVLWCVAKCKKTGQPMKVLLFGVFLPILIICLAVMPVTAGEYRAVLLTCETDRLIKSTLKSSWNVFLFMTQIELVSIAIIALVRVVVIWAPQTPKLGILGAVLLSGATLIYATVIGTIIGNKLDEVHSVHPFTDKSIKSIYFFAMTIPVFITAAAYIYMIYAIHQNNLRLAAHQEQEGETTSMDPVTHAMLPVFISNLFFRMPHAIYHLMNYQPVYMSEIFHVIFATHFVVDPLAYMWFNRSCREKVKSSARQVIQVMSSFRTRLSALRLGANASCGQQKENSSTEVQEESNV